jgi:hypothetical protein
MQRDSIFKFGEFKMNDRIEFLREALYEAIAGGKKDEILRTSVELDAEIVHEMIKFIPNKIISK